MFKEGVEDLDVWEFRSSIQLSHMNVEKRRLSIVFCVLTDNGNKEG